MTEMGMRTETRQAENVLISEFPLNTIITGPALLAAICKIEGYTRASTRIQPDDLEAAFTELWLAPVGHRRTIEHLTISRSEKFMSVLIKKPRKGTCHASIEVWRGYAGAWLGRREGF